MNIAYTRRRPKELVGCTICIASLRFLVLMLYDDGYLMQNHYTGEMHVTSLDEFFVMLYDPENAGIIRIEPAPLTVVPSLADALRMTTIEEDEAVA